MQLVGTRCRTCEKDIAFATEGIGCADCDLAYHRNCLADEICPGCGQNMAQREAEQDAEKERKLEQAHNQGQCLFFLGAGLLFMAQVLNALANFSQAGGVTMKSIFAVLVTIAILVALWSGVGWLRYLVSIWVTVNFVLYFGILRQVLKDFDPDRVNGEVIVVLLLAPTYIGVFIIFALSRGVRNYLAAREYRNE